MWRCFNKNVLMILLSERLGGRMNGSLEGSIYDSIELRVGGRERMRYRGKLLMVLISIITNRERETKALLVSEFML